LPKQNICVEFDGKQHFKEGVGSNVGKHQITYKDWLNISERDAIKTQFCCIQNIKLLRISYKQMSIISNILEESLLN